MPGKVVSREEWLAARKDFLLKEKASTRAVAALDAERQNLPMVKLDKTYTFEGPEGKVTLADLFDDRKQLILYHFMLSPEAEAGCEGCCFLADQLPSELSHLHTRSTTLVLVSRAPFENIEKFKKRMGWTFPWYSSFGTDFNYDFNVTLDAAVAPPIYNFQEKDASFKGDMPGMSIFFKEGDDIFHTYSTYARGLDGILVTSNLLDLTPLGRQDGPLGPGDFKRHDEYDEKDNGKNVKK